MKKYGIIGGIAVLVIAGGIYYSLSMATDTPEPLQTVQGETQQNKNTSSTASSSEKSTKTVQKPIVNTITGENVPEGFYDEVLSDGYTYNNPKPLDMSLVTPNENPNVPGHIPTKPYYEIFTQSRNIPNYPFEKENYGIDFAHVKGTNYRYLNIRFTPNDLGVYPVGKEAFTQWFQARYGFDFLFTGEDYITYDTFNQEENFSIVILGGDLHDIKNIVPDLESHKISAYNSSLALKEYYDDTLYQEALNKAREESQFDF